MSTAARTTIIERLRKKSAERRSVGDAATAKLLDDAASAIEPQIIDDADARRFRKLMDLAVYGTWQKDDKSPIQHVWRFKPIMGPHANLLAAVDGMER